MALESRAHHNDVLIKDKQDKLLKNIRSALTGNIASITKDFDDYYKEVDAINNLDTSNNDKMLEESNIQEVIEFINNTIAPQAAESKEFAIKKNLKAICDILIKEYETIIAVYNSLTEILAKAEEDVLKDFDQIQKTYSKELFSVYNSLEAIMERMSHETYKNIKKQKAYRFEKKNGFFK